MAFTLLLISPPEESPNEISTLVQLFEAGLGLFHLRKPYWPEAQLEDYFRAIPALFHSRIVLHSHYALAQRYALHGLHLPARSRHTWRPSLLPVGQSLSTSFHTLEEVQQHRRHYDYVLLSPIFDSISKAGYGSAFDLGSLPQALQQLQYRAQYAPHVIALGGITAENVGAAQQAGFAGAAVLGAVWQAPDPVAAFQAIRSKIS
ncbi:thiamine phosphate synthase [Hymenobacter sp. GOD-10R]|uniref:thiamine phosphate synthase n=1 Tax=Hymenobacter sp. GOD-10R TaxID=3093922 RepID=UPI002D79F96E|nr:thiamine phosphate synthase [Hymenobacter sp. GOD-10R]WRQ28862.1 thiamine phosphate synthase [Hymenobacter sp. GOD-10R]